MTREEIYRECLKKVDEDRCTSLMMELATGTGKTRLSIMLVNHLCETVYKGKETSMLLLVAKRVHKQTWRDEFEKWGGISVSNVVIECYESMRKHADESFTFIVMDEIHHVKSEARLDLLSTIKYDYMIGLSATIPRGLKQYLRFHYHSQIVSCDITEAIEDEVLPEPEIILFPLKLDNSTPSETLEINPRGKGPVVHGVYKDRWKYKNSGVHAIVRCSQREKMNELDGLIQWEKARFMRTRNQGLEKRWLYHCGQRLEYLANCKNRIVSAILKKLDNERTITFCKTISQCEELGSNCIHSKNTLSTVLYNKFNQKEISHITAVNILNENANLVDCKYAIFANLSSSEVVIPQRLGRAMRHRHPVIIVPYYQDTREQEIVEGMFMGYDQSFIKKINSIKEL